MSDVYLVTHEHYDRSRDEWNPAEFSYDGAISNINDLGEAVMAAYYANPSLNVAIIDRETGVVSNIKALRVESDDNGENPSHTLWIEVEEW